MYPENPRRNTSNRRLYEHEIWYISDTARIRTRNLSQVRAHSTRPQLSTCSLRIWVYYLRIISDIRSKPLLYTSFPCWYRQKASFAGQWEPATLTLRREPASSVTPTSRLMKRPILWTWRRRMKRDGYDVYAWQSKDPESQWCLYL